jgi:hypothetical protein
MVSNTLEIDLEDLLATLERLRVEHADDPAYVKLRTDLPEDWPL